MPTFNGAETIGETLRSILKQSFTDFEIIIQDDASTDDTEKVIKEFADPRIKFFQNSQNLGYPGNLEEARKKAGGEIVYLMGQDDILAEKALEATWQAFQRPEGVGAVTRPYFWFDSDLKRPVRAKKQLNPSADEVVHITDDPKRVVAVFETLDQLSGLAYRREFLDTPFHPDIFPCHVYPFAAIFKRHPVVFLKDYDVAVRISSSQARKISSIYDKSPLQSWVEMFETVFAGEELAKIKKFCLQNFVLRNYVGLVQIRNYAKYRYVWREIYFLIKYRWQNIFSPQFWFFSLGCALMPPFLLIPLVDWYKEKINSRLIKIDANF